MFIFIIGVSRICSQVAIISSNTIQLDVSLIATKAVYPEVSVISVIVRINLSSITCPTKKIHAFP